MRNIKSKKATKKEIEFFIKNIGDLDIFDFFGLAKLCNVDIFKKEENKENNSNNTYDAATVIKNGDAVDKKDGAAAKNIPDVRDFYEILYDIVTYYENAKKERRQNLINLVIDCRNVNLKKKKRGGQNGLKPQDSTEQTILSSETVQ